MVIVLDNGTEHSWDEGVEFSIVWHGRRYGFRTLEDAEDAFFTIIEERLSSPDGIFVGMTDEYAEIIEDI